MSLLDHIERRFRRYALPHVTIGLIVLQVVAYFAAQGEMLKAPAGGVQPLTVLDRIALVPNKVLEGQVWRLVTFVCEPPTMNIFFAFFFWYLFYLMGEALEASWARSATTSTCSSATWPPWPCRSFRPACRPRSASCKAPCSWPLPPFFPVS